MDYGGTAEELESHFNSCGQINRVTILCDKFSGHPKGSVQCAGGAGGLQGVPGALLTPLPTHSYAYIEFEEQSSVKAAVELDESVFRGRVIKVRAGRALGGCSPHSQPCLPGAGPNPSSSSPSSPCRCCPRGPTCPASAARTAVATGAASTPGAGWAAGETPTGSSPGSGGEPTGESGRGGSSGVQLDGLPCAPPTLGGWRRALEGRNVWQAGAVTCPCRNLGSGGWALHCPSLTSLSAGPGCGAPLVLGVQPLEG